MKKREIEEETRNQMMQNLFGEQSEDDEEEEVDSEHVAAANQLGFQSDEAEGEAEIDGEGEGEVEGEVEVESDAEAHEIDVDQAGSEGEKVQSSQEREISDQKIGSEGNEADSEEEGYGQRVVTSRRREVVASESEGSEDNRYADNDNEDEVNQARKASRSPKEQNDHEVVRDVFGDSDEDEIADFGARNEVEPDSHRSPIEEEGNYEKDLRPEDIVPDEDADGHYESEDENPGQKLKERPVGPPLELEVALRPPLGRPDMMNVIKVSNIMGIEQKPFDSASFVEEDVFVTDESGTNKRIRLEDNIVRYRLVKNHDGTVSYESNARYIQWSDGSIQLQIGNEVLDISVQDAHHDQAHLFLRHGKGILQSQGRLLRKMKFMPSSLESKSHRLLTALVDSRHKKLYKVKNWVTETDPEREKENKEKIEGQTIKANETLHKKREKVNHKYSRTVTRGRQLSPGFLEDALDEEEEHEDYNSSRRPQTRRRIEEDLEAEAQAEKRINNAKRQQVHKAAPGKPSSARASRHPVEESSASEREESEYETDGEDVERGTRYEDDHEDEYEEDMEAEPEGIDLASEEEEELRRRPKEAGGRNLKRKEIESDEDSPPRKTINRRKAVVFDSDED